MLEHRPTHASSAATWLRARAESVRDGQPAGSLCRWWLCDDPPMFKREPVTAMVGDRPVRCLICGGEQFWDRAVQLNTSGLEFLGIEWANASATGLICTECGYVHEFAGNAIQLYKTG